MFIARLLLASKLELQIVTTGVGGQLEVIRRNICICSLDIQETQF